jgi:AcrR family transcriptional regulator
VSSLDEDGAAGRPAQRRRTRKAIVDAAMRLLAAGESPSAGDVAREADVSRRTIYLYFPTFEHLLVDATLGLLGSTGAVAAVAAGNDGDGSPEERLDRTIRAIQRGAAETEHLGRTLIRLTAAAPAALGAPPRRGYRRVEWLDTALAPLREQLDEESFEQLISALVLVSGWEPLMILRDVRGLDAAAAEDLCAWAARALLRQAQRPAR